MLFFTCNKGLVTRYLIFILLHRLNKSYEALEYGFEADAFTDLTGGLAEWYNPAELKEHDFYLIRAAYQCGAVIGCLSVVSVVSSCKVSVKLKK